MGVDPVTLPCNGATGDQYGENTSNIKENEVFANLSNFFRFSNLLFHSNDYVHLVARYPGYILCVGRFRHIP